MKVTYMLWGLEDTTWHFLKEGTDYDEVLQGLYPDFTFESRNITFLILILRDERFKVYRVTQQKSW